MHLLYYIHCNSILVKQASNTYSPTEPMRHPVHACRILSTATAAYKPKQHRHQTKTQMHSNPRTTGAFFGEEALLRLAQIYGHLGGATAENAHARSQLLLFRFCNGQWSAAANSP